MSLSRTQVNPTTLTIWLDAFTDSKPVHWNAGSFLGAVDKFCNSQNLDAKRYEALHDHLALNSPYGLAVWHESRGGYEVKCIGIKA